MDISQIQVPNGIDPDLFWKAVREAVEAVQQDDTGTVQVEPEPEAPVVPTIPAAVAVSEGVINAATYTITAVEGGRYGHVKVATYVPDGDTDEQQDDDGTQRVRAKRAAPFTVQHHVMGTMMAIVEYENTTGRDSNVTRPDLIGWAITEPARKAVNGGQGHYRIYNGRDLIKDVASHTGVTYTKAQIRSALSSLVEIGSVKESGKVSKAKRYTLSDTGYVAAIKAAKGEQQ